MSQAKVDKYKQEKANRKQILAKEKRNRALTKAGLTIVGLALVAWIGISAVDFIRESRPVKTIYANTKGIDDYMNELYAEETESTEQVQETETVESTEIVEETEGAE